MSTILSEETIAKNKTRNEHIVMAFPDDFETYGNKYYGSLLEEAIADVATFGKNATLFDLLKADEDYVEYEISPDANYLIYADNLMKRRMNIEEVVADERNLLNPAVANSNWEAGYRNAIARFLAKNARPVRLNHSYYGWYDYNFSEKNLKIVAILSFVEMQWNEFEGTINPASDHHGVSAEAIYEDGSSRHIRWAGTLSDIIREVVTS